MNKGKPPAAQPAVAATAATAAAAKPATESPKPPSPPSSAVVKDKKPPVDDAAAAKSGSPSPSSAAASDGDPSPTSKTKHSSLPSLSRVGSLGSLGKANSGTSLTRTVSTSSVESTAEKRLSVTKADNVTVSLLGGTPQRRHGSLRVKRTSIFSSFKDSFVSIDNGEISFAENELDLQKRQTHSLMDVREAKVVGPNSSQFVLRLGPASAGKAGAKVVTLKAETPKDACDWIATVHHELRNQFIVCRESIKKVQEAGHVDRLEPLFRQSLDLLRVVTDGNDDADTADTLEEYADWLETRGRVDESATTKKQAKAIRRRVAGVDSRPASVEYTSSDPEDSGTSPPMRSKSPPGLPPRVPTKSPVMPQKSL